MLNNYKQLQKIARKYISGERGGVFQNIAWLFFEHISRMVFGLVVGAWVARYLGAEQFGILSYSIAFVSLFNPLINLGLDSLVVRLIVQESELKDQILGTTFWLKLVSSLLCCSLIFWVRIYGYSENSITFQIITILAIANIFRSFDIVDFWFRSQVQSKFSVIAKNSAFLLATGFKVLLILLQAPLLAFASAMLLESIGGAIALLMVYHFQECSFSLAWNSSLAKRMLKESWPLILSGLSVVIYLKIDIIMLKEILGEKETGLYAAATKLSEIWYFIPTAIAASVAPSIYAAKKDNAYVYTQKNEKLIILLIRLAIMIAIPISVLSPLIVEVIYGNEYIESASILSVHIWAILFVSMGVSSSIWLLAENLTSISFLRTFMGAVTNIIFNWILIPRYSGLGAAFATAISYMVSGYVGHLFFEKTHQMFVLQSKSLLFLR